MRDSTRPIPVSEAREIAVREHADQKDRDGSRHIDHVARVAAGVPDADEYQRVAWLHDVVEDSDVALEDLRDKLSPAEGEALRLLTRDETESYMRYVGRIIEAEGEAGVLARTVKQADMLDNLRRCVAGQDPAVAQYGEALGALWAGLTPAPREVVRSTPAPADPGLVTDEFEIRLARPEDAKAMAAIFEEAVQAAEGTFETSTPPLQNFVDAIATQLTVVAVMRGAVVGWARLGPYMPNRDGIGLYQLYVSRAHRGQGLGTQLLAVLSSRAESEGYFKIVGRIFASNRPAIRVARTCGFSEVGAHERHGQVRGEWQDVVVVERLLGVAAR